MSIPPRLRKRPIDHLEDVFARPAFVAGEPGVTTWNYTEYTLIVNVAGYAAVAVPAGFVDGLPVGLQLIGPPDREPLLLRAARALERDRPWAEHHPPVS
jgi:Asp-tRNA(Asn)/Glu-tRNA(Gln) amidotransferase A subunit family amidase